MAYGPKRVNTQGVILARTDYGEADRIITFLTPDQGKIKVIAKSVRKSKSKLAGGIELFSISELGFVNGRGEIHTLVFSRLLKHYGHIVKDIDRTNLGYRFIKQTNRATEDAAEEGYFQLLNSGFEALDDPELDLALAGLWFDMQLLKLSGHEPNLQTDITGARLQEAETYNFYLDRMRFSPKRTKEGRYNGKHIKFLRLGFAAHRPQILSQIQDVARLGNETQALVQTMLKSFVRL